MFLLFYCLSLLLALLLQTSPVLFTVGSGLRVDVALLMVVYFSLFWGGVRAVGLGFLSGLCQDALSSEMLGVNALSKSVSAFVVYVLSRNIQVHHIVAQGLFTCLAVLVDLLIHWVIMEVFQLHAFTLQVVVLHTFAQQMLLSVLCIPFVCRGLHALSKALRVKVDKGQDHASS